MPKPVQIAIVVICLAGAGYLLISYATKEGPAAHEEIPEAFIYKCHNRDCGEVFTWNRGDNTGDRGVNQCPKCMTEEADRCARCQECGHVQVLRGHGTYQSPCPECGVELVPLRDQK